MSVEAGQRLGKYQLIERVGQGGMAVVYRGHDTSLKREVAVKVLHHHLAEHEEARKRFGREAHAVAKLRHENILEIHDFSGEESDENYIVTEFIEGCTLKEFVTDHVIHFPEIGAMIAVQVCKALAHAHGMGVLHRDVKPENIMIRSDGVVKLTDFGISQMIDLRRMTVTGQLLGSPAYMSPEHVLGGELDFRTDVFAVGIVLYQLVTGELPFEGKNPHEILKRIADCVYLDATRANARVGKEMGRIIATALSRDPEDRYADISLMQQALERYLEGSGLDRSKSELERFFAAPAAYQMALGKRLVEYLCERGKRLLHGERTQALELFNRVLSIDGSNEEVLRFLRKAGVRDRWIRIAGVMLGLSGLVLCGLLIRFALGSNAQSSILAQDASLGLDTTAALRPADAAAPSLDANVPSKSDAQTLAMKNSIDAGQARVIVDAAVRSVRPRRNNKDAGITAAARRRSLTLNITPGGSEYRIGLGAWKQVEGTTAAVRLPAGEQEISARNPLCCQETSRKISAEFVDSSLRMNLRFLPAQVIPRCLEPGVRVQINGKRATIDRSATIPITRVFGTEIVRVAFVSDDQVDEQQVTVKATQTLELRCRF